MNDDNIFEDADHVAAVVMWAIVGGIVALLLVGLFSLAWRFTQ